jgi:hypothetical protein
VFIKIHGRVILRQKFRPWRGQHNVLCFDEFGLIGFEHGASSQLLVSTLKMPNKLCATNVEEWRMQLRQVITIGESVGLHTQTRNPSVCVKIFKNICMNSCVFIK